MEKVILDDFEAHFTHTLKWYTEAQPVTLASLMIPECSIHLSEHPSYFLGALYISLSIPHGALSISLSIPRGSWVFHPSL